MKNGMNKEVMMLHEFQTPPMSSNLSSLRKKKNQEKTVYRPHAVFKNDIFIIPVNWKYNISSFLIWLSLYTYLKLAL